MKKAYFSAALFAAVSLVPASCLFAQTSTTTTHTPPNPAQMVANKIARLTTLLTLTSTQQTQATTIFTTEETSVSGLWSSVKTAHATLKTAVEANDVATIGTVATQLGTLEAQQIQARSIADASFYALLTADQQAKFNSLPHGGMNGMVGHHGGPGGGGPGGGF